MNADPDNEVPKFDFIRSFLPSSTEGELHDADHAFFAYIELVKSICDRLSEESSPAGTDDSTKDVLCDRVTDNKEKQ
jgi:hypothetical protein